MTEKDPALLKLQRSIQVMRKANRGIEISKKLKAISLVFFSFPDLFFFSSYLFG
jgi:hypothetical protein